MTADSGDNARRGGWARLCGWLLGIVLEPGSKRWLLLALTAVMLAAMAWLALDRVNPADNPSALVTQDATLYVEARNAGALLAKANNWPWWRAEIRESSPDAKQWTSLQIGLAGLASGKAPHLGVRMPLRWLVAADRLAFAVKTDEPEDSWLVLLDPPNPAECLAELRIEPGIRLEPETEAAGGIVHRLSGPSGATLYLAAIGPWLAISNQAKAPAFALESWDNPDFSLAQSGLVAEWRRGADLRGMANPVYLSQTAPAAARLNAAEWLSPEARIAFGVGLDASGNLEAHLETRLFSGGARGGGFRPVARILAAMAGVVCIILIAGVILAALGMGAWLRILALKAGVVPAAAPLPVKPSAAFREDAGLEDEAEEVAAVAEEIGGGGGSGMA